jgi:hypothetical protein
MTTASMAALALLGGCSSGKAPSQNNSTFTYLLDRTSTWRESAPDTLPPLPAGNAKLYMFYVSNNTPLKFAIDPNSLSVGKDDVVRYTVVITSPDGARNVNYEGIHCAGFEWRLYASLNADHNGWDQTVANDWSRIETGTLNAYHSVLLQDYLCFNKIPAGNAREMLGRLQSGSIIKPDTI